MVMDKRNFMESVYIPLNVVFDMLLDVCFSKILTSNCYSVCVGGGGGGGGYGGGVVCGYQCDNKYMLKYFNTMSETP